MSVSKADRVISSDQLISNLGDIMTCLVVKEKKSFPVNALYGHLMARSHCRHVLNAGELARR